MDNQVVINVIVPIITTLLTSAVSVWIAIYIFNKESKHSKNEINEIKEINKCNALEFINFACASLILLRNESRIFSGELKKIKVELEKITIVNETLDEIKTSDLPKIFVNEYQNCKIVLRILEIEIRALLDELEAPGCTFEKDFFEKIGISRRTQLLMDTYSKYK
ncbi:hypothetical protein [Anaerotignum sp.]|uniref:hypothetical protein n=1 Tax=Anaerotignum sp. TaxID=2039241 RepID=UPI0027144E38|nr:hypothetical protein [Anaerotignum sp.]